MSSYRVRISSLAMAQLDRGAAWWRKNRDKAPDAFDHDTDEAFRLLRTNPLIGQRVRLRRPARRLWLERIRFYIYYRVKGDIIEIIAVWHASRGSRPNL
ncbi:MAG TPA: type II toxin-antitoxin system RelE/ParE family toxin [Thermoanaerobaculia bacterium]|nr:type II toxin-antitoxin system RelE/ParE family toxin [Thermoanaerobaculia bacterium]